MDADSSLPRINTRKISETAYDILREKIVSREFAPGQRLDLETIEKGLGISRTPLKEALMRLEIEGLVVIAPRSGTFVSDLSPQEISESFDVRCTLEVFALEQAVASMTDADLDELTGMVRELERLALVEDRDSIYPHYLALDHEFHRRLVRLSGNRRLCQSHEHENLHAQMARIRYRRSERELAMAQDEHGRILAALQARDADAAKAELRDHLQRAKRSLLDDMRRMAAE